jgi:hypothetical protein
MDWNGSMLAARAIKGRDIGQAYRGQDDISKSFARRPICGQAYPASLHRRASSLTVMADRRRYWICSKKFRMHTATRETSLPTGSEDFVPYLEPFLFQSETLASKSDRTRRSAS